MKARADHRHYLLHILALASFAIAQPLFDIISRNVELLVAQKVALSDLLLLILLASLALPLLISLPGMLIRLKFSKLGNHVLLATIAAEVGLFSLMALKNLFSLPDIVLIMTALLAGGGFALFYQRRQPVRLFCTYISPLGDHLPGFVFVECCISR